MQLPEHIEASEVHRAIDAQEAGVQLTWIPLDCEEQPCGFDIIEAAALRLKALLRTGIPGPHVCYSFFWWRLYFMVSHFWRSTRALTVAVMVSAVPCMVLAQTEHVVGPQEFLKAEQGATHARQQNIDTLQGFLSSTEARQALNKAHMDPTQVEKAVAGLSDQELAQLASRATTAQNKFAAGNLSDRDLLIVLVCIAALILIIVAVH